MKKQIAAIFEIAEIQAQGTAIYDGRSDRFLFASPICQPYMSGAAKAYAAIEFIDRLKFNVSHQLFRCDINPSARRGRDCEERMSVREIVGYGANPACG